MLQRFTDLAQVRKQLEVVSEGAQRLVDGTALAQQGSAALTQGIDALQSGAAGIGKGVAQVRDTGVAANAAFERVIDLVLALLPPGHPQLDEVRQALVAAKELMRALTAGAGQVADGARQISAAPRALDTGGRTLQAGADQSHDGTGEIANVVDDTLHKVPDTNRRADRRRRQCARLARGYHDGQPESRPPVRPWIRTVLLLNRAVGGRAAGLTCSSGR